MATTVEDVVTAVQRQFGDETGAQIVSDDIIRWINEGQFQISRRISDSSGSASINVLVGDNKYNLPADFFKIVSAELDGRRLSVVSLAQLDAMYPDLNTSGHQGVVNAVATSLSAVNQYQLTLGPVPGAAGTLTVSYKSRPPIVDTPDDTLTIPDEYVTTLITYCLAKAKQLDGDMEGSIALRQQYKEEIAEDSHDSHHKDEETYPVIRPSPGDWY